MYLKDLGSVKSSVSLSYCDSMNGNTGYCMRSLNDRPAALFNCVRYSKLVILPSNHSWMIACRFSLGIKFGRSCFIISLYSLSLSYNINMTTLKLQQTIYHLIDIQFNQVNRDSLLSTRFLQRIIRFSIC